MNYAILGPQGGVYHIIDRQPLNVLQGATVVEISDAQAQQINEGFASTPRVFFFYKDGALLTIEEFRERQKAALIQKPNCIQLGEKFVITQGFDADRKVILLNKLLKAKEANAVTNFPKLVALYTWMETVQGMAVAGQTDFPSAPYTFEEVLAE